jgi:hypothetical protein
MKPRWNNGWAAPVALALTVAFVLAAASSTGAQTETKTMYAMGRGTIQVIRLYDRPDPLGKTMARVLAGTEIKVFTDQLYNKYWYKTDNGYYAHIRYLSETNPMAEAATGGEETTQVDTERESALLTKYGDLTLVRKILSHQIDIGFTMDQVLDSWGQPYSREVLQSTALGDRVQWRYEGDRKTYLIFDERKKVVEIRADKR